jgi:DNA polymerase III epsilon subunit-like protein
MYLVFDTETTGLPKNFNAPISDSANWPRLVQIAWAWYDAEGNRWDYHNHIIKPDGFTIPDDAASVHRISTERAIREGEPLAEIIEKFSQEVARAKYIVGHNIDFDEKIVGAELFRLSMPNIFLLANKMCTMRMSSDILKVPNGRGGYKWFNLSDLHQNLFGERFDEAHDAMVDVFACGRCLFGLKEKYGI